MNDIYCSSLSGVLAHGVDMNAGSGISLLVVMSIIVFMLLICKNDVKMPKGLFVSSIIPYVLVLICILHFSFELQIPKIIGYPCFAAVCYPSFFLIFIFGMGGIFFLGAFIIDTLIIFGIIRLILYIKGKIKAKNQAV
ncbi:MAG: hypothetical protein ABSE89_07170 [Sedimentisphaerales bacterium]